MFEFIYTTFQLVNGFENYEASWRGAEWEE